MAEAYEVLSGSEMRGIYDKYGEDVFKTETGGGCPSHAELNPFNMLDPVFGEMTFSGGAKSNDKFGEPYMAYLEVSLEDLYNGTTKSLSLGRYISCQQCYGNGTKTGRTLCYACQGSGFNSFKQMKVDCIECNGSGEVISDKNKCPSCKGSKVSEEHEVVEVIIFKGMKNKQKIIFEIQGHKAPGTISGDIVLILEQIEHPKFKRRHDNLFVEYSLSLTESLCGFQFSLTHLDGRKFLIKSNPGEIIKPGQSKVIYDEGMPQLIKPLTKGNLYIRFIVEFPKSGVFSPEQCIALTKVLPLKSSELSKEQLENCEETILKDFDIKEEIQRRACGGCAQQ